MTLSHLIMVSRAKDAGQANLVIEMNLQVIAGPDGDIVWVSSPLPGAVHNLTAARIWGLVRELAASDPALSSCRRRLRTFDPCATGAVARRAPGRPPKAEPGR